MPRSRWAAPLALLSMLGLSPVIAESADRTYRVGVQQVEYVTEADHRPMWMAPFYPTEAEGTDATRLRVPFTSNVELQAGAPIADDGTRRPLIMLSHGRGSDAWRYAWFAQALASRGYIVAGLNHYRANTYDQDIGHLANKTWQRPIDVSLDISHLLADPTWGRRIDADRIGVAGHSQGGFTALWIGGARVSPERFLAFQRRFIDNPLIPRFIRRDLPHDAQPALDAADKRVKAAFAMAPGIVQVFGMDPDGRRQMRIPAFLIVGASDTQAPPAENAVFASQHIPGAQLWVMPGAVDHEIFTSECDEEGGSEFPESCSDRPGVDRHALHLEIAAAALNFFSKSLHLQ